MRKVSIVTASMLALSLAALGASACEAGNRKHRKHKHHNRDEAAIILAFHTMYGVDGPFIGEENAIRGIVGDEAPWEIESVRGSLDTDGHLKITVRGLVFKD